MFCFNCSELVHATKPEVNDSEDKAFIFSVRSAPRAQEGKLHWPQQICKRIIEDLHLLGTVPWITERNYLSHNKKHSLLSIVKTTPSRYFRQETTLDIANNLKKKYRTNLLIKSLHHFQSRSATQRERRSTQAGVATYLLLTM